MTVLNANDAVSDPAALAPAEALRLVERHARAARDELAARTDAGADVLHYLAENGAAATRRAVAANPAASARSNRLLADDTEDDVRLELARKVGRLFPSLLDAERAHLGNLVLETLEKLAHDEAPHVRAMLAEEIKHYDCVPKPVVKLLAADSETSVHTPILQHSPLLDDKDLIEIVAAARASTVLEAVAKRKGLSAEVSDAVAASFDVSAVAALLQNTEASLRAKTLDRIIARAADIAEWHGPLVLRAELSQGAIHRLASFVAGALIDALAGRDGLDEATRKVLKEKMDRQRPPAPEAKADALAAAGPGGRLDEAALVEAIEACHRETVARALSVLAKTDEGVVRRILASGSAKAATALAWRAGLSMRTAFKLQTQVMRLTGGALLPARGGTDFPLNDDEMRWHLGYFGVS